MSKHGVADFASQLDHAARLRSFEMVAEVGLGQST
jgi:hypothetical protein